MGKITKMFVLPLALDDIYARAGMGVPLKNHAKTGTVMRYRAARNEAKIIASKHQCTDVCFITTAGYSATNPGTKVEERRLSLAEQLRHWVSQYDVNNIERFTAHPVAWGSASEIKAAVDWAIANGADPSDNSVCFVTATNAGHWLRIRIACWYLVPKAWQVKVGVARHHFSWRSWLHEIKSLPLTLIGKFPIRIQKGQKGD